ncbi:MAG: deoxyribose-phosphate aldolase [archaeon]|nr:deoxyribose-phosphate aldolase [archaeon]
MKIIEKINEYIDHTILKPESTQEDVIKICKEAIQYKFASVCVNPIYTSLVSERLKGSKVKTCTVIGFPLGSNTTYIKVKETEECIKNGANEIDMVINVGAVKAGDLEYIRSDISNVLNVTKGKALLKVILETCLLTDNEIISICNICKDLDVDFVKTSTGFNSSGATIKHVKLMRNIVGQKMGVKASGGIRSLETALNMINAGATRLGASSSLKIMDEIQK